MTELGRVPGVEQVESGASMQVEAALLVNRQIEWAVKSTGMLLALLDGLQRGELSNDDNQRPVATPIRRIGWSRLTLLVNWVAASALVRQVLGPRWLCRSGAVVKVWDAAVIAHGKRELVVRIMAGLRREVNCVVMFDGAPFTRGTLLVVTADALLDRWQAN